MEKDPFETRAHERLRSLAEMRRDLVSSIEQAQAAIRSIDDEAAEISRTFDTYARIMGLRLDDEAAKPSQDAASERAPRQATGALPRGAYADLAYQALIELGGTATLGEIVDLLRRTGRIPTEDHSYFSTRSALNRQPHRIAKTDKGFRLKELDVVDDRLRDLDHVSPQLVRRDALERRNE